MNPQAYKNAYDTAVNELTEIVATFEKLRVRKTQIEGLVSALQPFFGEGQLPTTARANDGATVPEIAASQAEAPEEYSFRDVPNPVPDGPETGGDPFQRRMKATFRFKGLAAQR
ncbi:MAG: hypothetical protein JST28_02140 [Acidobacteria bacterium]|nr:hypothetical protein [Acidobacteriota bacterium]